MARSARRLRRMVGAAAADLVSAGRRSGAAVVGGVLRARAGLQLSALHGDDPSRLRTRGGSIPLQAVHAPTSPRCSSPSASPRTCKLALLAWLFTVYVTWSPWHYTGQNFGLSMMFLRAARASTSRRAIGSGCTRRSSRRMRCCSRRSTKAHRSDPLMLSVGLPAGGVADDPDCRRPRAFLGAGVMTFQLAGCARRGQLLGAAAGDHAAYVTQALWFVIPIA